MNTVAESPIPKVKWDHCSRNGWNNMFQTKQLQSGDIPTIVSTWVKNVYVYIYIYTYIFIYIIWMCLILSVILVLFSQAWIQRRVSGAILQDLQLLEVPVLRAGHGSGKLLPLIFSRTPGGIKAVSVGITVDKHVRRKFRSQTSDNMERWKAEQGRGTEKRKIRREKIRRERVRGQKIQMREKVGKSRNTVFFQWFVAQEGRKVGSQKRRVRSQLATGAMKNCTPLWREAHFQVKMYKIPGVRTTFGSWDVEKVHAVVARSTFPSQNVQNTSASDHFWKLRCRKSARRCGAKHISKSKCTKHTILGPLLEVAMSKKCTPLWREAHFQVKSVKNWRSRTTFGGSDVEKVSKKCTPLWREAHFEVKSVKNWGFWAFVDVKMSKK